jgi:hypothetical protein
VIPRCIFVCRTALVHVCIILDWVAKERHAHAAFHQSQGGAHK